MKPRRTVETQCCFTLPGGDEDNDLWIKRARDDKGDPMLCSYWVPDEDERRRIAEGEGIELRIWGHGLPPVSLVVTEIKEFQA